MPMIPKKQKQKRQEESEQTSQEEPVAPFTSYGQHTSNTCCIAAALHFLLTCTRFVHAFVYNALDTSTDNEEDQVAYFAKHQGAGTFRTMSPGGKPVSLREEFKLWKEFVDHMTRDARKINSPPQRNNNQQQELFSPRSVGNWTGVVECNQMAQWRCRDLRVQINGQHTGNDKEAANQQQDAGAICMGLMDALLQAVNPDDMETMLVQEATRSNCGHVSQSHQAMCILVWSPDSTCATVAALLKHNEQISVQSTHCDARDFQTNQRCNATTAQMNMRKFPTKLPRLLFIHVQRTKWGARMEELNSKFPVELEQQLRLQQCNELGEETEEHTYIPMGYIVHSGDSLHCGHFTTWARKATFQSTASDKSFGVNNWHYFDDLAPNVADTGSGFNPERDATSSGYTHLQQNVVFIRYERIAIVKTARACAAAASSRDTPQQQQKQPSLDEHTPPDQMLFRHSVTPGEQKQSQQRSKQRIVTRNADAAASSTASTSFLAPTKQVQDVDFSEKTMEKDNENQTFWDSLAEFFF